jgi:hypothetical protein
MTRKNVLSILSHSGLAAWGSVLLLREGAGPLVALLAWGLVGLAWECGIQWLIWREPPVWIEALAFPAGAALVCGIWML